MSMNEPLKIGVLGCSQFAQRSMIPAIQALPELYHYIGIGSRDFAKANETAARFGGEAFASYEDVLASGLDAVYIPLPNGLHAEWIRKALDANCHVLVEKSLACHLDDVTLLCHEAERKRLVLVENFQFRFHRQLQLILDMLNAGEIGSIRSIRSSFGFPPFPDPDNIRYQSELGGGALLDAGAYPVKLSQILMGDNISIAAAKWSVSPQYGVDLWGGGFVRQNRGDLFMNFAFGFDHSYRCELEVWGSKGVLSTGRIFTAPPGHAVEIIVTKQGDTRQIEVEPDNHFVNMLTHFHGLTQDNKCVAGEYRQNMKQAELLNQFRTLAHEA